MLTKIDNMIKSYVEAGRKVYNKNSQNNKSNTQQTAEKQN